MEPALPGAEIVDEGLRDLREGREILPDLVRYPAIDPDSFRRAVDDFIRSLEQS